MRIRDQCWTHLWCQLLGTAPTDCTRGLFFWFLREDVIICIWIDTDVHVIINIDLCECMDTHICLKRNESEKCKGIENMSSDLQKQGAS